MNVWYWFRRNFRWRTIRSHARRYWRWLKCGFDPWDVWSLDAATAKFLWPRLEAMRDGHNGYPGILDDDVWTAMLDKMAQTMKFVATWDWEDDPTKVEYVQEGVDLLWEYFFNLWD